MNVIEASFVVAEPENELARACRALLDRLEREPFLLDTPLQPVEERFLYLYKAQQGYDALIPSNQTALPQPDISGNQIFSHFLFAHWG